MRAAAFPLFLVLIAGVPGTVAAQAIPDTTPAEPPRAVFRHDAPRFAVSVSIGTLGFSDLQRQGVLAERLLRDGTVGETESLVRRVTAEDGLQLGVSALLGLSQAWAVRAGASWGRASLAAGYSGEGELRQDVGALGPGGSSDLSVLTLEGALRFRMRSSRPFQPYAELGLAAIRLDAGEAPLAGAGPLAGSSSSLAGLAALGAIIPLRGPFAALIQASGTFFRTPLEGEEEGTSVAASQKLRVSFEAPAAGSFSDPALELARTVRLDLGLAIELGSVAAPRAAAAAPTTGSPP